MTHARRHAAHAIAALLMLSGMADVATAAPSASYACNVPRALLCEGCASQIQVTLLPGGACRVSFTTPATSSGGAPVGQEAISFHIEAPVVRMGAMRRRPAPWRLAAAQRRRPVPVQARCFHFNGNEYCE
jgi:hypothetical protein